MTDEQRQLITDNHNLIFSFLQRYNLDEEDFYDVAAIGLCRAAMTYKADIAKFSTYAYRCMLTTVNNEFKGKNRVKRIPEELIVSYNVECCAEDGDEISEFIDIFPSDVDIEKEVLLLTQIKEYLNGLTDRERLIFQLIIDGYTMREIAKMMGCSHQNISRIRLGIIRKLSE